jgi:hypothetical protein
VCWITRGADSADVLTTQPVQATLWGLGRSAMKRTATMNTTSSISVRTERAELDALVAELRSDH